VWNGRLMAQGASSEQNRFKAVLRQVTLAGTRTRERLRLTIGDLARTAMARAHDQAGQLARLAADIMDRNLYERANDCRWWALSPVLRRVLAAPPDAAGAVEMAGVLDHINRLYTVYSRLVVFDSDGHVRAVSRGNAAEGQADAPADARVGSAVPAGWLGAVRDLQHSQQYAVSPFEDTALHGNGPTYVYLAAIHAPGERRSLAGGIAIVFNSRDELATMLRDVFAGQAGCAAFVDAQGRVLAATDAALGAAFAGPLDAAGGVLEFGGKYYVCARTRAHGYREFKTSDGYDNHVHALVALRIGLSERRGTPYSEAQLTVRQSAGGQGTVPPREAAVFQVADGRYALPATLVLDAVSPQRLVPVPGSDRTLVGLLEIEDRAAGVRRVVRVLCARRLFGITHAARDGDGVVLLLQRPGGRGRVEFGLRVDDVLAVLEVPDAALLPTSAGLAGCGGWVAGMIDCVAQQGEKSEPVLVQWLDTEALMAPSGPLGAR
jgi:chemotaxis signal transduction protein